MSIRVYWLDCRKVDPAQVRQWMSPARLEKLDAIAHPDAKRQSAAAELALALALAREKHAPLQPVCWRALPGGKPVLDGGPHFSLSHAGDLAVCAVSEQEVGVDIEYPRPVSVRMRSRLLAQSEQARADDELLQTWVAKESYLKMTGEGLKRSMTEFAVEGSKVVVHGRVSAHVRMMRSPRAGYVLCVCSAQREEGELIELEW